MNYKYVFGPIYSHRLGHSLGIDLTGPVCSMDCLYCEVGKTEFFTDIQKEYVRAEEIFCELDSFFSKNKNTHVDYITLGGQGEPTLNMQLGKIIAYIKDNYPKIPLAVLTNSTTLMDEKVQENLLSADVILPSLDSLVEEEFHKINRPVKGLTAEKIAKALSAFALKYTGKIYLEILLLKGINDSEKNFLGLKEYVANNSFSRVDVTTLSRPGTAKNIFPVDKDTLHIWRESLNEKISQTSSEPVNEPADKLNGLNTLVSEKVNESVNRSNEQVNEALKSILTESAIRAESAISSQDEKEYSLQIFASLKRRAQRKEELTKALQISKVLVEKILNQLISEKKIISLIESDGIYYAVA